MTDTIDTAGTQTYLCPFCRMESDISGTACIRCGAPTDVRRAVTKSGWQEQPAIKDMAKIQFGQSTCQIEGTQVPTADFGLKDDQWIYFSHHSVLWTEPTVKLDTMPMSGGWNRVRAGLPLVMMQAHGPGHIGLSEDAPGEIIAVPLQHGQSIDVREHRFLTATGNVTYSWENSGIWFCTGTGDDKEWHYPLGRFVDRFTASQGPGLLLLHAPGNVFIRDLQPGEGILIQPTSLLYSDLGVGWQLHLEYPNADQTNWGRRFTNFNYRQVWLRMTGPGRVAVQSVFERPETSNRITDSSNRTARSW